MELKPLCVEQEVGGGRENEAASPAQPGLAGGGGGETTGRQPGDSRDQGEGDGGKEQKQLGRGSASSAATQPSPKSAARASTVLVPCGLQGFKLNRDLGLPVSS